ncbi:MAG: CDP-alcohol phosphatidyltransferase family protein [Myxococcales bacterium]|nr:CDP-alcohol phosphatidyltransferase family protein [Myxococcales bacterium]
MAHRAVQSSRELTDYRGSSSAEYASKRLSGSVWEHVPLATAAYRGCLVAGAAVGRTGVSANALTYASLVLAALAGVAAASGSFIAAALLVIASGAFDLFDGVVARATGSTSRWGALLDSTVDRLSDGLPLVGLAVFYAGHGSWVVAVPVLAILGSFTVSYVRARAEALGSVLPPLFMRRAERVLLLTLSLFAGIVPCKEHSLSAPLTLLGVAVLAASSFVGVVSALRAARQALAAPAPASRAHSD